MGDDAGEDEGADANAGGGDADEGEGEGDDGDAGDVGDVGDVECSAANDSTSPFSCIFAGILRCFLSTVCRIMGVGSSSFPIHECGSSSIGMML